MYEIRMNGSRNIPYLTLLLRHFNKVYKFALTAKIWCCENNKSYQNLHAQKPSLILLTMDYTLQLLVYLKSAVKYMARVFATLRLHGRPGHDSCQSALWDCFGGHIFNMVANLSPKIVPQCTLTTILTRSPTQPQSGEYSFHKLKSHVTSKHAYETRHSAYWGVVTFADQDPDWGFKKEFTSQWLEVPIRRISLWI